MDGGEQHQIYAHAWSLRVAVRPTRGTSTLQPRCHCASFITSLLILKEHPQRITMWVPLCQVGVRLQGVFGGFHPRLVTLGHPRGWGFCQAAALAGNTSGFAPFCRR